MTSNKKFDAKSYSITHVINQGITCLISWNLG